MKRLALALAVTLACTDRPPRQPTRVVVPEPPPPPVGLFGTWVRTAPGDGAADTIVLRPDSSGRGWVSDGKQRIPLTRWRIAYLSTESPAARVDRGMKLQDGGDADCTFKSSAGCRSAPVLCVHDIDGDRCFVFAYRGDSLKVTANTWYRRLEPTAVDSTRARKTAT